ncbi:MAG: hypothetical protein MUO80_00685 [Dehalococcoidia bacterium]|nr:hypothetical protein [Dehalococcoidia bacterium]
MPQSIEYHKLMTEIVYINLPGPSQPVDGMTGGELLHGFLADLYATPNPDIKNFVMALCSKWNVRYVQSGGTDSRDIAKKR